MKPDAEQLAPDPCPFCGGEAFSFRRGGAWGVKCSGENHFIHSYGATEAEAIAAWNTRVPSRLQSEVIEGLRGAIAVSRSKVRAMRDLLSDAREIVAVLGENFMDETGDDGEVHLDLIRRFDEALSASLEGGGAKQSSPSVDKSAAGPLSPCPDAQRSDGKE